jgi:hypothetical protein
MENTPKSSLSVQSLVSNTNSESSQMTQYRAIREKEKYYERVERYAQKQLEMEAKIELIQRNIQEKRKLI